MQNQKGTIVNEKGSMQNQKGSMQNEKECIENEKGSMQNEKECIENEKAGIENEKECIKNAHVNKRSQKEDLKKCAAARHRLFLDNGKNRKIYAFLEQTKVAKKLIKSPKKGVELGNLHPICLF